jgi:dTMP kinase
MGGGLVIPLGKRFTDRVLGAGDAGYSLVLFAMGIGAAVGILAVVVLQRVLPREFMFCACVLGGGIALLLAASMSALGAALWCVGAFGVAAGAGFVLGNTILQTDVDDALRGRVFAAFYALVRMSLILPLLLGPFAASGLDKLSQSAFGDDRGIVVAGVFFDLPGVRLTLWAGAFIILAAAFLAFYSLGRERVSTRTASAT